MKGEKLKGIITITGVADHFEASFATGGGAEARTPKTYLRIHQSPYNLLQAITMVIEVCMQNFESLTFPLQEI